MECSSVGSDYIRQTLRTSPMLSGGNSRPIMLSGAAQHIVFATSYINLDELRYRSAICDEIIQRHCGVGQ